MSADSRLGEYYPSKGYVKNRDKPAHPEPITDSGHPGNGWIGLSKKELVAAMILKSLIEKHGLEHKNNCGVTIKHDWIFTDAINAADKFFDELEK